MQRYLPLGLIVGLLIAFRLLGSALPESQPNFQPLAALFFCGAMLASGWRGFAIPFGIWAVTYFFAKGPVTDLPIFATTLLAYVAVFFMGKALSGQSFPKLLAGSLASAVIFHLITNGAAWIGDPMYEKSLTGLWQSLWTGPTGSTIPSWVFLRNFAAANVLFTAIFIGAQLRLPKPKVAAAQPVLAK
ncbi:hypothetical protein JIN84_04560 [Luteolibacter yonseiensis]|uniref:Uncharacterized protein n=1 Tax=Luteolibacter yonseiensis TaxID=1144680 RepID=A0A934R174_9BACT|nr:DUF6580 family putative transport protein [Luteolibacter yonseiensis]MBK1814874.1 hypothetical protein [Luteolibacter yonseiensis]